MTQTTGLSKREQYNNLIAEMREEERITMQEAKELFTSDDMMNFKKRINDLKLRTVPGSTYEQIFTGLSDTLGSITSILNNTITNNIPVPITPVPNPVITPLIGSEADGENTPNE